MGWFVRKTDNGITFNGTKPPEGISYVELSFETPDSTLYGMGCNFDDLMTIAKKYKEEGLDTLVTSFYEYKGEE